MSRQISFQTKVISGYRITIPSLEREILGIEEGDIVIVSIEKYPKAQLSNGEPSEKEVVC